MYPEEIPLKNEWKRFRAFIRILEAFNKRLENPTIEHPNIFLVLFRP